MATNARLRWFRLYDEARTDPKLASLSDAQFRVWFNLLCLSNEQSERGVIAGYTPRLLAIEVSHGDVNLLSETVNALSELRMIETSEETDDVNFIHWQERQYDKPSDRPEATRERKARSRENTSRDVTPGHAMSHGSHTPSRIEREGEEEESIHPIGDSGNGGILGASAPAAVAANPITPPLDIKTLAQGVAKAAHLTADASALETLVERFAAKNGRSWLLDETSAATEWIADPARNKPGKNHRTMTLAFLRGWLKRAEDGYHGSHEGQHDRTQHQGQATEPQRRPANTYQRHDREDHFRVGSITDEEIQRRNAQLRPLRPLPPEPQAS